MPPKTDNATLVIQIQMNSEFNVMRSVKMQRHTLHFLMQTGHEARNYTFGRALSEVLYPQRFIIFISSFKKSGEQHRRFSTDQGETQTYINLCYAYYAHF